MGAPAQHIVNKVLLKGQGFSTNTVFPWRNEMSRYFHQDFPQQLGALLDELFPSEEWVQIDRLQINLNTQPEMETSLFQQSLLTQLRQQLETIKITREQDAPGISKAPKKTNASMKALEAWFYYLKKGHYPWWQLTAPEGRVLLAASRVHPEYFKTTLQPLLKWTVVCQRMLGSLDTDMFFELSGFFSGSESAGAFKESIQKKQPRLFLASGVSFDAMMNLILKCSLLQMGFLLDFHQQQAFEKLVDRHIAFVQTFNSRTAQTMSEARFTNLLLAENPTEPTVQSPFASSTNNTLETDPDADVIWIENAGLVILHPFLKTLFQNSGLLSADGNLAQPLKGLALLHYLMYGMKEYDESGMVLSKILCGLSIQDPCFPEPIDAAAQAACDQLLAAVIEHWSVLKNTSPAGLQQTFIQRAGKLKYTGSCWQLIVAPKTEDILMNQLPWGIAVIRLPWMKEMLHVEWGG